MTKSIRPITPDEVAKKKVDVVPEQAIEAFNNMIAQTWDGVRAEFTVVEVREMMINLLGRARGLPDSENMRKQLKDEILDKGYLNVEPLFRESGWNVVCDVPGYNESYPSKFIFKVKS